MSSPEFVIEWLTRAAACGFVILVLAAMAVRLCRQPADRVRVTGFALVGALLVPWLAFVPGLPRCSLGVLPPEPVVAVEAVLEPFAPSIAQPELAQRPGDGPSIQSAESKAENPAPQPAVTIAPLEPANIPPSPTIEESPASPARSSWTATQIILVAYGTGTAAFLLWSLLGLWRLSLLYRSAHAAPSEVVSLLREIAGPAADRVRILISKRIDAPIAFAGWRPIIVLPESACDPDDLDALRYGLAHEWSHVERGDIWRWYIITFAQVVLFYQPLFWLLRRQLRLSQDYLADARAADQTDEPVDYAEYLVTLARRRLGIPGLALGITDRRSNLTRRVHMLLLNRTPLERRCRAAWTCGAALVTLGLLISLSAVRLTAAHSPAPEANADDAKKPADSPAKGETLNYSGKVSDKNTGKPLPGATVIVRRSLLGDPEREDNNPVIQETKHTTDAEGKYSFTIPPEQSSQRYLYIELDVEHPDYAPQKNFGYALSMILKNEKLGGRPFFENVELRPGKATTGVVKTPEGKPIAGVKVMAYSVTSKRKQGEFEYGSFAETRTDPDGKFRLTLVSPGWGVVWVLPEEYVPTTTVVQEKRGDLGTFTLKTGPRLRGTVLDAKGKPVAGLVVNAESQDRNEEITEPVADSINRSAVTNEKGEFEMKPLPPGHYLVKPGDYPRDNSIDRKDKKKQSMPGVFVGTKVTLKASDAPEPVEVRAVPHVTIEAQYLDSQGKPTRGHGCHIFGQLDGVFWFGEGKADANGKVVARVPHGLENTQVDLMTNEHGVLRWRKAKGEPLNNNRQVQLKTMNDDVKGIEIIRYTAPILLVKVTTKDGSKTVNPAVTALYGSGKGQFPGMLIVGGRNSDVSFEHQEDGRFRSEQLFPDEEVTITAHADGYASKSEKLKLAESTTKEIELVLEKEPAKDGEKKDK